MIKSDLNIDDLFNRYFLGQLEDKEYELLKHLLTNEEYQEKFRESKKQWNENPVSNDHVLKNWLTVKYKISGSKVYKKTRSVETKVLYRVLAYAAVLIIGLFIGVLTNYIISGTSAKQQEIVCETPRGAKSKVVLPDGSEVWLNAKSRLAYKPFQKQRQVELQGEAFLKVTPDKSKPFTVVTPDCNIEVLGTSFNIMAYDDFDRSEITLIEGEVRVYNETTSKFISPNQLALVKNGKISVSNVEAKQSIFWVDNKFNFNNIPLSELFKRLENWYDVDILIKGKLDNNSTFTGVFKNEETISQVLEALKVYMPIRYKKINTKEVEIWFNK